MSSICLTIYNYLLSVIQQIFYKNNNHNEEDNIISIDQEWENILNEEL